jgi:hypothetical protein
MITCTLRYVIDPRRRVEFEEYGRMSTALVEKFGGRHHGCFLPPDDAGNVAWALVSFPTPAEFERYRVESSNDPDGAAARRHADVTRCILGCEHGFLQPVYFGDSRTEYLHQRELEHQ